MRAAEKHEKDTNRINAMYSIMKNPHQADPDVVERFERSPYYPVLNFERGTMTTRGCEVERGEVKNVKDFEG